MTTRAQHVRWLRTRLRVIELRDDALAGEFILTAEKTPAAEPIGKFRHIPTRPRPVLILPQRHRALRKMLMNLIVRRPT